MTTTLPTTVILRLPSKYAPSDNSPDFVSPSLDWLHRTWSVTHSTLAMWRTARNVRITYKPLPAIPVASPGWMSWLSSFFSSPSPSSAGETLARVDDLVQYESSSGKSGLKSISGIDTAASLGDSSSWNWRGSGWLFFVGSHWEILGWGERDLPESEGGRKERWVVTWFEATIFTKEGVDIYSDRREGGSKELVEEIMEGLKGLEGAKELAGMCERDMKEVEIELPWQE